MSNAISAALAFAIQSYQQPTEGFSVAVVAKVTAVVKDAAIKGCALPNCAADVKQAPIAKVHDVPAKVMPSHPAPPALVLPAKGTHDARGYIVAMRRASTRDERIQAIAGFVGYDRALDFSVNEFRANQTARRDLSPSNGAGMTRGEERSAIRSVKGYVAGMPNAVRKTILDLAGREALALDTMKEQQAIVSDPSKTEQERTLAEGLIQLEQERLRSIREELSQYQIENV